MNILLDYGGAGRGVLSSAAVPQMVNASLGLGLTIVPHHMLDCVERVDDTMEMVIEGMRFPVYSRCSLLV